jgi:glycosyltransferase involved in cell wall biosynthesis
MISYLSKTRNIKKEKFALVRNWQDDEKFLSFPLIKNESVFIFMYVGSISASAGVELLITAFDQVNLPASELLIVGNGSEKENCSRLAKKLNNHNIKFFEVIPEEVPEIQSKADVLLLPLRKGISKTATPSKLTAYLFSAKPVIACVEQESDVADILMSANCGFVVEPENTALLAEEMKNVFEKTPTELLQMGASGRKYAEEYLSKQKNLEKVVSIIENCIHEN